MKIVTLFSVTIAVAMLSGCGGSKTQAPPPAGEQLPDFILNPPKEEGYLFGSGMSEKSSPQLAKEVADLRAKKEVAKVLSQKVSSLMKDFLGESGVGDSAEVTEFTNSVTKAVTDVDLVGCEIVKREFESGKMYALAKYPLDSQMRDTIKGVVKKQMSSNDAMLSAFRAKQGFDELDKELQKLN